MVKDGAERERRWRLLNFGAWGEVCLRVCRLLSFCVTVLFCSFVVSMDLQ